ncbi:uncharacterized protein LOC123292931 [Chrysoperla carnea]|uniref:uncharacterized protein LOC123292931 n=1 Tax=Chrysoperla carnea TaxID=189513 RepID=UPI001D05E10B|nr:uncharacterized protein LOC123292931 [Chrysoperla carnea]
MLRKIGTFIVICSTIAVISCKPIDNENSAEGSYEYEAPTKVDLSLDANVNIKPATNFLEPKLDFSAEVGGASGIGQIVSVFNGPPTKIEYAAQENESIFSKKDSFYTGLHEALANIFQYKPIVDTIKEEDKYGNDGEKFRSIGKFVVGKAEGLSNFLNKAAEVPGQVFKAIVQTTNEKLNHLGGKIVGLEK